jgi:hypothetical protein
MRICTRINVLDEAALLNKRVPSEYESGGGPS